MRVKHEIRLKVKKIPKGFRGGIPEFANAVTKQLVIEVWKKVK